MTRIFENWTRIVGHIEQWVGFREISWARVRAPLFL